MSPAVLAGGLTVDGAIAQTPNPAPDSHQNRPAGQALPEIAPTPTMIPQSVLPERFDHPGESAPAIATSTVQPSTAVQVASTESWAIAPQPTPPEIFDHPETRFSASNAQILEEEGTGLSSEPLSLQERGRGEVLSASSIQIPAGNPQNNPSIQEPRDQVPPKAPSVPQPASPSDIPFSQPTPAQLTPITVPQSDSVQDEVEVKQFQFTTYKDGDEFRIFLVLTGFEFVREEA